MSEVYQCPACATTPGLGVFRRAGVREGTRSTKLAVLRLKAGKTKQPIQTSPGHKQVLSAECCDLKYCDPLSRETVMVKSKKEMLV